MERCSISMLCERKKRSVSRSCRKFDRTQKWKTLCVETRSASRIQAFAESDKFIFGRDCWEKNLLFSAEMNFVIFTF